MTYDQLAQEALNQKHLADPRVGDYWQEMYHPVCVVVARIGPGVLVVDSRVSGDANVLDAKGMKWYSLADFSKRLKYDEGGRGPAAEKTWCDVMPERMTQFATDMATQAA